MRVAPTSQRHVDEQRRYFPDWIDCLPASCPELEADHNSYLAGGYAEEFGYRAQLENIRGASVLDDESPDLWSERFAQAQATHPGYPLKPRPLVTDLDETPVEPRNYEGRAGRKAADIECHGAVIVVSSQSNARKRHQVVQRLTLVPLQWTSAAILLRWMFGRRYRADEVIDSADRMAARNASIPGT
jgi:hypothetical protein